MEDVKPISIFIFLFWVIAVSICLIVPIFFPEALYPCLGIAVYALLFHIIPGLFLLEIERKLYSRCWHYLKTRKWKT
jgi:hypothetical protein